MRDLTEKRELLISRERLTVLEGRGVSDEDLGTERQRRRNI